MPEPLRVLCVEDHPLLRGGLRLLIDTVPDLQLVGEAATLAEAEQLLSDLAPDLVLLDVELPDGSGLDALPSFAARAAVLILTMHDDPALVTTALKAGARGYLLKESDPEQLLAAVRAVAAGQTVLGARVNPALAATAGSGPLGRLTARERQVLGLMSRGQGNERIAGVLGISPKTVANTVSAVLSKLAARDRAHAVAIARDLQL